MTTIDGDYGLRGDLTMLVLMALDAVDDFLSKARFKGLCGWDPFFGVVFSWAIVMYVETVA